MKPTNNVDMEPVIRNVRDIDTANRQAIEHVIGRELGEDQKVIIQVVPATVEPADTAGDTPSAPGRLPE